MSKTHFLRKRIKQFHCTTSMYYEDHNRLPEWLQSETPLTLTPHLCFDVGASKHKSGVRVRGISIGLEWIGWPWSWNFLVHLEVNLLLYTCIFSKHLMSWQKQTFFSSPAPILLIVSLWNDTNHLCFVRITHKPIPVHGHINSWKKVTVHNFLANCSIVSTCTTIWC